MKHLLAKLALMFALALPVSAMAQQRACGLVLADSASTAIALNIGNGLVEGNPLLGSPEAILFGVAARCAIAYKLAELPQPEQTNNLHLFEAVHVGIVTSNIWHIAAVATGNPGIAALGFLFGAGFGYRDWKSGEEERYKINEFMYLCNQYKAEPSTPSDPAENRKCVYKDKIVN